MRWAARLARRGLAVGIDASPAMVELARRLSAELANVAFYRTEFSRHELPFASFDVVLTMEAICYMTDLGEALREILRLLRPGGVFASALGLLLGERAEPRLARLRRDVHEAAQRQAVAHALEAAGFEAVS